MKLFIKGKGTEISLSPSDFLAAGGEGKVYFKGGTVYKVCDTGKMIPEGKFSELSALDNLHIIKPEDILVDSKNHPVGYTMRYVSDTYTLCQLFTKAFRLRNNINPGQVFCLVQQMQQTIDYIHKKNILIVDLNEFNFLLDKSFKDIYFIDVNSYQTSSYAATAIMDSIRDRHCNGNFNKETDWFSFAIISFQMFIGIHPYKGRHTKYNFEERMKHNISILNSEVTYPTAACQPFGVVPDAYMRWYKAVLEKGERIPPPAMITGSILINIPTTKVVGGKILAITKIRKFDTPLVHYCQSFGSEVYITTDKVYAGVAECENPGEKELHVGFTPRKNLPILASLDNKSVKLYDIINKKELPFICAVDKIMDFDGRIYIQNGTNIIEVIFTEIANQVIASAHIVAFVLEQTVKFYPGVVIQSLFDAYYVSIFPESNQCQQIALKELNDYKVIDAKYENHILMIIGANKSGNYSRFTFIFDKDWTYAVREVKNITFMGLNFTVLDNGVCVQIDEEENIQVFRAEKGGNIKLIDDDVIDHDMGLFHKGAQIMFSKGDTLYGMTMKKP